MSVKRIRKLNVSFYGVSEAREKLNYITMEKQVVYCLTLDGQTAIYLDVDGLCEAIKMEVEDQDFEGLKNCTYEVSFKEMTEKEIELLPEFDGF